MHQIDTPCRTPQSADTEGIAFLQFLADQRSLSTSEPAEQPITKYRIVEWPDFHRHRVKSFCPWLFHSEYGEQATAIARRRISDSFDFWKTTSAAAIHDSVQV